MMQLPALATLALGVLDDKLKGSAQFMLSEFLDLGNSREEFRLKVGDPLEKAALMGIDWTYKSDDNPPAKKFR
ncbi:unnamed protein product [Ilex paraguariensis]|uniref:Uncharacterized protein n=1 Tax=Ilex paraguariensis TaxID=185542 RepID=A0ABC8TH94_9AQUA